MSRGRCYLILAPVDPDDIEALRERVWQLEGVLTDRSWIPLDWGLNLHETAVLNLLAVRSLVTKAQIWQALYGNDPDGGPDIKLADIWIHRLRRKLATHGLSIVTRWGQGWHLDDAARAIVNRLRGNGVPASEAEGRNSRARQE